VSIADRGDLKGVLTSRAVLVALAILAAIYMARETHIEWSKLAGANGFGSDFHGTIWEPDRAVLHGRSPYPSPDALPTVPAIYSPTIYLATLPLGGLTVHVATWAWFVVLAALAVGTLAVLGVRDPWCYVLAVLSLPVVDALVLGNASIAIAFLVALAWRYRDHPVLAPVAVASAVSIKSWLWPLLVWLLILRVRAGVRAALILTTGVLVAWAAIGFRGLLDYPRLLHEEASRYVHGGTLFVSALVQLDVPVKIAAAAGIAGALALLAVAAFGSSDEVEAFSLALLAGLVATPVSWPHYLLLMGIPIAILWPSLSLAWLWFPALWLGRHLASEWWSQAGASVALCVLATIPVLLVAARSRRLRYLS
jgi:hypothetical protein